MTPITCPKCNHVNPTPSGQPLEACPACGVIYAKARPRVQAAAAGDGLQAAARAARAEAAAAQAQQPAQAAAASAVPLGQRVGGWLIIGVVGVVVYASITGGRSEQEQLASVQRYEQRERDERELQRVLLQAQQQARRNEVARDAEARYQIAARNGSAMDACVQAGFVKAAWLQAGNEAEYARWTGVHRQRCAAAGISP